MNVIVESDHEIGRRHGGDRPKQPASERRGGERGLAAAAKGLKQLPLIPQC